MKYNVEVLVTLKENVRDPQGTAVDTVLKRTGLEDNAGVRVGKYFTLTVSAKNDDEAKEKADRICGDVLSNPILESYKIGRFEKL
ncbi:MAG: phosphoribosylformylglycinamidine synthase subunit PurS [bacterium]